MLTIDLGTREYYDSDTNEFRYENLGVVRFEYSLKVMYDWEYKWRIPFLSGNYSDESLMDFYKMMAIDPISEEWIDGKVMEKLSKYIQDDSTATTFTSYESSQNGVKMARQKNYTAEEIYALMIAANVPLEFENRNLNRLLVIIRIISAQNSPPKQMTRDEILAQNRELNRQRRAELKTKG